MAEEWRDVKDYEGCYQVSNYGRIKSYKNNLILKQRVYAKYLYVCLCHNNKKEMKRVHRLVAQAFLPNPNNLPQVNHKDGNRENNNVNNLEWVTASQNIIHGYKMNLCYANEKKVLQYDLKGNLIKEWKSTMEIQRQLKYNNSCICACCNNRNKTAYGYIWKYKNKGE